MCCIIFKVNYRAKKAQRRKLKGEMRVNKKAYWDAAPVCKRSSSQPAFVLVLNTYCIYSTTHSFGFQTVPLLKIKQCLFNLATVCVKSDMTCHSWILRLCIFLLHSANHAGASRRAGTAGKSVFDVRAAESQATELPLSDTACVWAKKPVSLDMTPQGTLLPACLGWKGRPRTNKKKKKWERCMPLAFI